MKKGFTLSEVLITLSVIGVLAALTLPTLVTTYKSVIVKNELKKIYSSLQNIMLYAVPDRNWDLLPLKNANNIAIKNKNKTFNIHVLNN